MDDKQGQIGIAVAGLGYVGREHLRAFHRQGARIAAVYEPDAAQATRVLAEETIECKRYSTFDEMARADDVDAIVISSPNPFHADQAISAARAGKAVLLEKPAALTSEDLDRVGRVVEDTGVLCEVDFVLRWHPLFERMLEVVRAGTIGDVFCVEAEMLYGELEVPEPDWERTVGGGRNIHLAVGCHAYDQVTQLAASPAEAVLGLSTRRSTRWEFDPTSEVLIRFSNGVIGRVTTILEAQMSYAFNVRVFGTQGTILDGKLTRPSDGGVPPAEPLIEGSVDVSQLPFERVAGDFMASVRGERPVRASFASVRHVFDLALAAERACASGELVAVGKVQKR
jgi:predicted dehydrogenase